ncbi:MAG TPA: type II secretion system protein GspN [Candidatus Binatus sp.]|uniref:type II secretion system protein GspN n=1 Tax=Candidatus Binatus sp. TaxID=2811406 RepID=UPI002B490510|nr:type II secretion system protein GspN [Candidatus Binatus sp.]HKN14436.1 type II secretion system protein GspN [Candidatus Binatus sp.]
MSAPIRRPALVRIGYVVVGLTLFAAYLISTFPYSTTLSKMLAPMGLEVSSESQKASFPFGARLSNVRLRSTRPASAGLLLESPALTIAPAFLSMLTLHPGVRVKAALYDGVVNFTIRPSGGGTAISYDLDSVDIARQHLFAIPGADTSGRLSGSGKLLLSSGDIAESGDGELSAAGLTVISALATSPIHLGDGHSKFNLDQGTVTIEEFTTSGGDLTLTAEGTIQLAPDPGQSQLAIQFTLSTAPAAASNLAVLLAILPHPSGPLPYHLTGTLNAPRIS